MEDFVKDMIIGTLSKLDLGKVVSDTLNNYTDMSVIRSYAEKVRPGLQGIGMSIAALLFLISLLELAQNDNFTLETFIKFFVKLATGVFLVINTEAICNLCEGVGDLVAKELVFDASEFSISELDNKAQEIIERDYKDLSLIKIAIKLIGNDLVLGVVASALEIITMMICFTRFFEMAIRSTLMPIAMGAVTDDGWKGAAGRYIKKYMAVCCQGAVLIIIGGVYSNLVLSMGGSVPMYIGCGIACVSIMFKSMGYINDAFGV